jgi:hypothetical protein
MVARARKSKKTVAIHLDAATLRKLVQAAQGLGQLAEAVAMAADDPALRRELSSGPKKSAKKSAKRRTKKSR